jgi:hypothetical protein
MENHTFSDLNELVTDVQLLAAGRGVPGVVEAGVQYHPPQHHVRTQMSRHRLPAGLHRHFQSKYICYSLVLKPFKTTFDCKNQSIMVLPHVVSQNHF